MGWTSVISDGRRKAEEDRTIAKDVVDRQRSMALEDETNAYNRQVNADKLVQLRQLAAERERNLEVARQQREQAKNATLSSQSPFGDTQQGVGIGAGNAAAPGAQQPYAPLAEYDTTAQVNADTAFEADKLLAEENQNAEVARLSALKAKDTEMWNTGITSIKKGQGDTTFESFLPTYEKPGDAGHSGLQKLVGVDSDVVQAAQDFVTNTESFFEGAGGTGQKYIGANWLSQTLNWAGINPNNISDEEFNRLSEESKVLEDFFNTDVGSNSKAEEYFIANPSEINEANPFYHMTEAERRQVDPDGSKQREALLSYYYSTIAPQLKKGDGLRAPKLGGVRTEPEIKKAKADYANYVTATNNGIEALEQLKVGATKAEKAQLKKYEADVAAAAKAKEDGDAKREQELLSQITSNPIHRRLNKEAFGKDIQRISDARAEKVKMFQLASRTGDLEKSNLYRAEVELLDATLWKEMNEQGITDIKTGKGPEILEGTMSEFLGSNIRLQPRSDGNWHVIANGQLLDNTESKAGGTKWTLANLTSASKREADDVYAAAEKADAAAVRTARIKGMVTEKDLFEATKAANIEIIKATGELNKELLKQMGAKFSGTSAEGSTLIGFNGKVYEHNPNRPPVILDSGEEFNPDPVRMLKGINYGDIFTTDAGLDTEKFITSISK